MTDNKPLLGILSNKWIISARFERWRLRLMLRYHQNETNPADYLSHRQLPAPSRTDTLTEDYINYVCQTATPKAMAVEEVKSGTMCDPVLQAVIQSINNRKHL